MDKLKKLLSKYREIIVYIIVGVMTTIFCWLVCWILEHFIFDANDSFQNFLINSLSWVAGVCFAYPLNRKWVFRSTNPAIAKEFIGFAGSRVSTWVLDVIIMWLFVNIIPFTGIIASITTGLGYSFDAATLDSLNFWTAKIFISSVLVMVANYVFSKLLIFKKPKNDSNAN